MFRRKLFSLAAFMLLFATAAPVVADAQTSVEIELIRPLKHNISAAEAVERSGLPLGSHFIHFSQHWVRLGKNVSFGFEGKGGNSNLASSYSDANIRERVQKFASNNGLTSAYRGGLLVDIEHPVHPRKLREHLRNPVALQTIVSEWQRRLRVVREVFPQAELMLYGFPTPTPAGMRTWDETREVYFRVGDMGMFENVDTIAPVLYARFGPNDRSYSEGLAPTHNAALQLAFEMKGRYGLDVVPLYGTLVYNGRSKNNREVVSREYFSEVFDIVRAAGLPRIAFWVTDRAHLDTLREKIEWREGVYRAR